MQSVLRSTLVYCLLVWLVEAQDNGLIIVGEPLRSLNLTEAEVWTIDTNVDTSGFVVNVTTAENCLLIYLLDSSMARITPQWPEYQIIHHGATTIMIINWTSQNGLVHVSMTPTSSECEIASIEAYFAEMFTSTGSLEGEYFMVPDSFHFFHMVIPPSMVNYVGFSSSDCVLQNSLYIAYGNLYASEYSYNTIISGFINSTYSEGEVVLPSTSSGQFNLVFHNIQNQNCTYLITQYPAVLVSLKYGAKLTQTIQPLQYRFYQLAPSPNSINEDTTKYQLAISPLSSPNLNLGIYAQMNQIPTLISATNQDLHNDYLNLTIQWSDLYYASVLNGYDMNVTFSIAFKQLPSRGTFPDWVPFIIIIVLIMLVAFGIRVLKRILLKRRINRAYINVPINTSQIPKSDEEGQPVDPEPIVIND